MNLDFVTDNISVGTPPQSPSDVRDLESLAITHVLNVHTVDDYILKDSIFKYCWNPTSDWNPLVPFGGDHKPDEWFKKSLDFWLNPEPEWRLFIHCSAGVNRSATTAWMFLRALQIGGFDCDYIIDHHRFVATFGTFFDHPWREDAESALIRFGYIRARSRLLVRPTSSERDRGNPS